jgi:AcrR family transcriptional regulator
VFARVAAAVGAAPASLYRYVTGRDELIDLMADAVSAEFDLSQPVTGALAR